MTAKFSVYHEPGTSTSGRRFFSNLAEGLSKHAVPLSDLPAAVLFNISAPLRKILTARLCGQVVVLRVDGLYADFLSPAFIATFRWPMRLLLSAALKRGGARGRLAHFANFLNENWTGFARICLANRIVYQSEFSREVHQRFFPSKPFDVIVNGSFYVGKNGTHRASGDAINLVTIYDEFRPQKRMQDLVRFVEWARQVKQVPVNLAILGYTGKWPASVSAEVKRFVEGAPYIKTLPRFGSFEGEAARLLGDADMYATFTFRDSCPNAVVEAMAFGLPVLALDSGGVPDIVGDAGELIPSGDDDSDFFFSGRYECDFPPICFETVLAALLKVHADLPRYRARVRARFADQLEMSVVVSKYRRTMLDAMEGVRVG